MYVVTFFSLDSLTVLMQSAAAKFCVKCDKTNCNDGLWSMDIELCKLPTHNCYTAKLSRNRK